jgi:epoxyqueuosine reductase
MIFPFLNRYFLKRASRSWGADLFGVADVREIRKEFALPADTIRRFDRAVCLGVGLSASVLDEIVQEPTRLYYHHYRVVNTALDRIALSVARWIEARGWSALAIPASQITDWQKQVAHLSHRTVGHRAGLGWIGRNNLLVSPRLGARFRMATVLTDMPLTVDRPVSGGCGACVACVGACPANAIRPRQEDFDRAACLEMLKGFQKKNIVGQYICGVCVKACRGTLKH